MDNMVLKIEWVKAIAILPEPSDFLECLIEYKETRHSAFKFPTETALFTAIQPEFDKLNFPIDNGLNCADLKPTGVVVEK